MNSPFLGLGPRSGWLERDVFLDMLGPFTAMAVE